MLYLEFFNTEEPDWISDFVQKQEKEEKLKKVKVIYW